MRQALRALRVVNADAVFTAADRRTPTYANDPHGWLADPTIFGREFGEAQMTAFLQSNGDTVLPLPPPFFEVPITNPNNLECLHYPDPQTGQQPHPAPFQPDCPPPARQARQAAAGAGSSGNPGATGSPGAGGPSGRVIVPAAVSALPSTASATGAPWWLVVLFATSVMALRVRRRA